VKIGNNFTNFFDISAMSDPRMAGNFSIKRLFLYLPVHEIQCSCPYFY
jgi:hypothetical protein